MKSLDDVTPDEWSDSAARIRKEGGSHYKHEQYETWDVIKDWGLGYFDGNAVKYLSRWHRKGTPIEDLRKARHYIDKLIQLELAKADIKFKRTAEYDVSLRQYVLRPGNDEISS